MPESEWIFSNCQIHFAKNPEKKNRTKLYRYCLLCKINAEERYVNPGRTSGIDLSSMSHCCQGWHISSILGLSFMIVGWWPQLQILSSIQGRKKSGVYQPQIFSFISKTKAFPETSSRYPLPSHWPQRRCYGYLLVQRGLKRLSLYLSTILLWT